MAGYVAPDGRPPQAPGVGKNAKRHDLEAPATPGVRNSDMQQGDRQKLEAAQKIAPRPKKGSPQGGAQPNRNQGGGGGMEVPDPIEFASGRIGGGVPAPAAQGTEPFDAEKWRPLLEAIARNPRASGPLTTTIAQQLSNLSRQGQTSSVTIVDQNAAEEAMRRSL